jgi:DNA repair protein SbcC/Rad50
MRPVRLELEGFTSFREPEAIDFGDAEYFALVGPTGSGKSTVIDAICFALYGSVPRYEDRRAVAPVISQGKLEAKVRLDFLIDGSTYTAVRVVRRSGSGASTREARLERDGEVLAGTADELSAIVAELVGLTFEHFTRCVVLPQGEFARFLRDKPKERQDLLVRLLNLGIYRRMREEATRRAASFKTEAALSEERLEKDLAFASDDALTEAQQRTALLEKLRREVDDARPKLEALVREVSEAEAAEKVAQERLLLIAGLEAPKDADGLADEVSRAQAALEQAATALEEAADRVDKANETLAGRPEKAELEAARRAHAAAATLRVQLVEQRKALKVAEKSEEDAAKALEAARKTATSTGKALEEVRQVHAAHDLAEGLKKGDVCPVCLRKVTSLPDHRKPRDLSKAKKQAAESERVLSSAQETHTATTVAVKAAEADLAATETRLGDLAPDLETHPDEKEVEAALERLTEAEQELAGARKEEGSARKRHKDAQDQISSLRERETKARKLFDKARDQLAPLGPPPAERDDLSADWLALIEWAATQVAGIEEDLKAAHERRDSALTDRERLFAHIHERCRECNVEVEDDKETEAVIEAHTRAREEVQRITRGLEEAKELRAKIEQIGRDQKIAHQLALHLSASPGRFESWIVNEALQRLVVGATSILRQLSNDQYALTVDGSGNFQVTDRHNADEARSARTLSGGETFLASLSLALALADELQDLAAEGAARLDAIFLDEGFGTLDPETLDTVAATVENLAAGGRMVGVVTHVRELAERIPLQFRVRKERTSTVERVET